MTRPKRSAAASWVRSLQRAYGAATRSVLREGNRAVGHAVKHAVKVAVEKRQPPPGAGEWISGVAFGPAGTRRYYLFRPANVRYSERLPLLVMLHGCGQDAKSFAASTRMNRIAARERFLVLYPEQDRRANPQGCWNWFDTRSGGAFREAATILAAIDQMCTLYPVDATRVALAGLSAGASMAALLASRYPERFRAVAMHSGIPPGAAHSSASALSAMHGFRSPSPPPAGQNLPPLLVIHGVADHVVSVQNGQAATQLWAEAGQAREHARRLVRRGNRHAMHITDYKAKGKTIAVLCEIDALAHAWSGGDERLAYCDATGPDASRMIWAFVSKRFKSF